MHQGRVQLDRTCISCWSLRNGDWETTKPNRGSKVRPEGAAWDEDTEGRGDPGKDLLHVTDSVFFSSLLSPLYPSEESLLCCWKKWPPNLTHTHTHTHKCTHTHTLIYRHTHTHIQTHTHSSQPTVVSGQCDSSMCTVWNIQLLGQKRKRLENHTWAFHASIQRWPRWHHPRFIAQNESLRTGNTAVSWASLSIDILQWNSWEQCCQVFSPWRSFWGTALCRDWMWSYPPRVGLEGISYFHPLACVSPTPYSTSVCAKWD